MSLVGQIGPSQDAQGPRRRLGSVFSVLAFLLLFFPLPFVLEVCWGAVIVGLFPCLRGNSLSWALVPPIGLPWIYLIWRLWSAPKGAKSRLRWMPIAALVGSACILLGVFAVQMLEGDLNPKRWNEIEAVDVLHRARDAEKAYAAAHAGSFSPTWEDAAQSLSGSRLVTGTKRGFRFTYTPGPKDRDGRIRSYTVIAQPITFGKTACRSFFTDESGVTRSRSENRPATARDSPLEQ